MTEFKYDECLGVDLKIPHKHATAMENLLADDKARKARMNTIHQDALDRIRKAEGPIGQDDEDAFDQYIMPIMGCLAIGAIIALTILVY